MRKPHRQQHEGKGSKESLCPRDCDGLGPLSRPELTQLVPCPLEQPLSRHISLPDKLPIVASCLYSEP